MPWTHRVRASKPAVGGGGCREGLLGEMTLERCCSVEGGEKGERAFRAAKRDYEGTEAQP